MTTSNFHNCQDVAVENESSWSVEVGVKNELNDSRQFIIFLYFWWSEYLNLEIE